MFTASRHLMRIWIPADATGGISIASYQLLIDDNFIEKHRPIKVSIRAASERRQNTWFISLLKRFVSLETCFSSTTGLWQINLLSHTLCFLTIPHSEFLIEFIRWKERISCIFFSFHFRLTARAMPMPLPNDLPFQDSTKFFSPSNIFIGVGTKTNQFRCENESMLLHK